MMTYWRQWNCAPQQKIIEGLHTKVEDCLPMDKVTW